MIDFLNALDTSRYGNFVCNYLNGVQFGSIAVPKNVEEVYNKANSRLEVCRNISEGASYSTINHMPRRPKGNKKNGNKKNKNKNNESKEKLDKKNDSKKSSGDNGKKSLRKRIK